MSKSANATAPPAYERLDAAAAAAPAGPYGQPPTQNWGAGQLLPAGLRDQFALSTKTFAERYWIVDNSTSMTTGDGKHLTGTSSSRQLVSCSRWQELVDALRYHGETAIALRAPTHFLLLNQPAGAPKRYLFGATPLTQPTHDGDVFIENVEEDERRQLESLCRTQPTGATPLCATIRTVVEEIRRLAPTLNAQHRRAVITIASDGEASDGDVAAALAPLKDLPVMVVIRLCTDDQRIVEYWNEADAEVEVDMDVLDDLEGESQEVHNHNPWLTYGLPLQRLREWGTANKLIDVLDERRLSPHEIQDMTRLIYGDRTAGDLPNPETEWDHYSRRLAMVNRNAHSSVWDPTRKKMRPWIRDGGKLQKACGHSTSCIIL